MLDTKKLIEMEQKTFTGWDFDYISQRTEKKPLPWDYKTFILNYLKPDDMLLDMGTGGGEFLLSLNHSYNNTCASESYKPNYNLCLNKLKPLGIDVRYFVKDGDIPFSDQVFNMIINRHDSYQPKKVYNSLKDGGVFITQQVGGLNNYLLSQKVLGYPYKDFDQNKWDLEHAVAALEETGFDILFKDEVVSRCKYFDCYTLTYYCKIIQWEFPNFSVDSCLDQLNAINQEIDRNGFVEGQEHRFIIVARKNL
ncbi:class I SAM-dependent methyltransferase [Haloplasma contractile]|uniref:Methyltransferase protein n=1 Tax=Haloplasma contractile SSD-17B TaxID=1033810 RepID=U2ECF0_9MOLU|nr:hypothetical protein [Haloplasma contractile]ERJ12446.1 Methyltransferase protein [Haloplasma contractile SSD-17B]